MPHSERAIDQWREVPVTPENYRTLADDLGSLVGASRANLLIPAEAAVALEALATELGTAHHRLLNLVSSRYGRAFGEWASRAGATVLTYEAQPRLAFTAAEVDDVLSAHPEIDVLQFAHGEAITGIVHPAQAIIDVAHARGVAVVLDAVASIAAVTVPNDADAVVIGPQKAIEGAAGISVVSLNGRGLSLLQPDVVATPSILSLRYLRDTWLETGRGFVPGTPSSLDIMATVRALDRLRQESLAGRIARHEQAAEELRDRLRTAGFELWSADDAACNPLATAVILGADVDVAKVVAATAFAGEPWTNDVDGAPANVVRTTHFGLDATLERVERRVAALCSSSRTIASDVR